jgi:hypothetical protein
VRKIDKLIIHCSDSWDDENELAIYKYKKPFKNLSQDQQKHIAWLMEYNNGLGLEQINAIHRDERKFSPASNGIHAGYHWIIKRDGIAEMGRPDSDAGIHCKGQNASSIAFCLIGRGKFTDEQYKTLDWLLINYLAMYGLEPKQVYGHCEFESAKAIGKTCPNFKNMDSFRDQLELKYNS